jgi:SnoaL-like protein
MPSSETLDRFINRVEQNAHDLAVAEFYTDDASMQENHAPPRVGRNAHVENERRVLARARSIRSECVRPVFVNGDYVVIRWRFRFDWLDGTVTELEELAYQRWAGESIAEETFFYDPVQRVPRRADA